MNLVWIDLEMTGLNPDSERIIEIATVVTDANLNVLAEGPSLAIKQSNSYLFMSSNKPNASRPKTFLTLIGFKIRTLSIKKFF